ncbi:hypothetical protein [Streptomyces sp. NPDC006463]|uniref:hypothetical protein n=1 Tax=Streptomyces sp. NPDC006463 TaxID=3364746 RepID=UPI003694DC78
MRRTSEAGTLISGASAGAGAGTGAQASARARAVPPQSDGCEEFVRAVYQHHATPLLRYAARLLGGDRHCGQSVAHAADKLGIPPGTVKSRSYYALRALRDILRARGLVQP